MKNTEANRNALTENAEKIETDQRQIRVRNIEFGIRICLRWYERGEVYIEVDVEVQLQ